MKYFSSVKEWFDAGMPFNSYTNGDCMEAMALMPDKYAELSLVDPPYGIGFDGEVEGMVLAETKRHKPRKLKGYIRKDWDSKKPTQEYFDELFRISKNQIIWGGNHYALPQSSGWVIWDKLKPEDWSLAPCELAWTSFNKIACRKFTLLWHGFQKGEQGERFHPTQKPIALYKWLLTNYAKQGDKILDTHVGSASSIIACLDLGFEITGFELDPDYYRDSMKRIEKYLSEPKLFTPEEIPTKQENNLFTS